MIPYFFWFLLFILPFLVNPLGGAFFEPIKVILAEVIIEILAAYILIRQKFRLNWSVLIPYGLIFVLATLDLILFPSPTVFLGNQFRLQGTFLLWNLLILSLISAQTKITSDRLVSNKLFFLLPLPTLLLSIFLFGTESNGRAVGSLGEPNALAAAAVFFWPWVWFMVGKKWSNWIRVGSLILAFVIIFLSGSRSGLIALAIQMLFLGILKWRNNFKMALLVALVFFFSSLILPVVDESNGYKPSWNSPIPVSNYKFED